MWANKSKRHGSKAIAGFGRSIRVRAVLAAWHSSTGDYSRRKRGVVSTYRIMKASLVWQPTYAQTYIRVLSLIAWHSHGSLTRLMTRVQQC